MFYPAEFLGFFKRYPWCVSGPAPAALNTGHPGHCEKIPLVALAIWIRV